MEGIKFDSRQVLMLTGMENDEQVLSAVADAMCEIGLVKDTYKQAILDREKEFPTGLNTGGCNIAIPHADVTHVNEASICVGILEEPVMFHAMDEPDDLIPVKMVIMLALKEAHSHLDMLQKVVELIQDQALVKQIVETKEKDTVCQLLKEKLL